MTTIDERFTDRLNAVLDLGFTLEEVEKLDVYANADDQCYCGVKLEALRRVFGPEQETSFGHFRTVTVDGICFTAVELPADATT
jgi:hypothetical protein